MSENSTPLIVGFVGRVGSGKDTAAEFTEKYFNTRTFYFAWADILKNIVHSTFGISNKSADEIKRKLDIKPFNGKNLREVYQNLGENIKSFFGERVWVDITLENVKATQENIRANLILCTDIRYNYEEAALRKYAEDCGFDCIVIKLNNLNQSQRTDHLSSKEQEHISEIQNNIKSDYSVQAGTLSDLKSQLHKIYDRYSTNN